MITLAVIDDDPMLLDLMAELVRERSWTMLALQDSRTAAGAVLHAMPDAILLDIRLEAGSTGWDVLEALKAEPATRSIPVIVWSADSKSLDQKRELLESLGIPALEKPFEIDDLFRSLDAVLPQASEAGSEPSDLSA